MIFKLNRGVLLAIVFVLLYCVGLAVQHQVAARAVVSSNSLAGHKVAIDPGHGAQDPGAIGRSGTKEKGINLAVSKDLANMLRQAGATVVMTRTTDKDISQMGKDASFRQRFVTGMKKRIQIVNESHADILVSVHANAAGNSRWSGAQTFYDGKYPEQSKLLAKAIQAQLIAITGRTKRTINRRINHYMLKHADMPAVTVEMGFLSNPTEEKLLKQEKYQHKLAYAIFAGISKYFADQPAAKVSATTASH